MKRLLLLGEVNGFPQTRRRQAARSLCREIKSNRFCTASQRKKARSKTPATASVIEQKNILERTRDLT
jgi:hypothetical protein